MFREVFVKTAAGILSFSLTTPMMYDCLVGTSIWDRLILAKNSDTAIDRDGAKVSSISRTFDGMCVKTIVFTRPIFDAIFEDAIYEMAVSTPATANMYDNEERSAPNLV